MVFLLLTKQFISYMYAGGGLGGWRGAGGAGGGWGGAGGGWRGLGGAGGGWRETTLSENFALLSEFL